MVFATQQMPVSAPPSGQEVSRQTGASDPSQTPAPIAIDAAESPASRGTGLAFIASLVFHVSLLLVLACWAFTAGRRSEGIIFTAVEGDSAETSFEISEAVESEPEFDQIAPEIPELDVSVDVDLDHLLEPVEPVEPTPAALTSVEVGSAAETLKPNRRRGASFFGTYASGNRFVYIIDSSRSMAGDRWTYACNKLVDSIRGLSADQEFFVMCFDRQTSFLFGAKRDELDYVQATKGVSERVRRWLRSKSGTLGSSTMPAEALLLSMDMNADAVFLLSDGELKDNSLMMMRQFRRKSRDKLPPIHAIHLFSPQGRATLELIANDSGGNFTHIGEPRRW
ncbi:MAG TPA: hypothetical protein DDW52_11020 [Planctomycetaceae bacterium]|nr:hypothetical protein [Planctomycetaceae bacterium]